MKNMNNDNNNNGDDNDGDVCHNFRKKKTNDNNNNNNNMTFQISDTKCFTNEAGNKENGRTRLIVVKCV